MSTELVQRDTIRDLVRAWQESSAQVRSAFAAIVEAEERLNKVFALGGTSTMRVSANGSRYTENYEDVERTLGALRRQVWYCLAERLELRRILSISRWKELSSAIDKGELPDVTEETVDAFVRCHLESLGTILEESIREVYGWLRPRLGSYAARYKTNDSIEVGPRVVLTGMICRNWAGRGFEVNYLRTQETIALDNVFAALDGRGQVAATYWGELGDAIKASADGIGETPYFRFRCCKNGNLHLEFKRRDLLARFNAVAGGKNLRPSKAA